jgi:transcriptional regulator with XRE-family HTH domain
MVKQIVAPRTRMEEARRRLGLSQLKLAAASNFGSASEISRFETGYGKPYPRVAARIAAVLGLDPDELCLPPKGA